jgi:hypothetical protein
MVTKILLGFIVCASLLCVVSAWAAENAGPDARTERIVALLAEINRVPRCLPPRGADRRLARGVGA